MSKLRLQKIIASAGICSRRKAENLLIEARVEINGKTAKLGDKADPKVDQILLDKNPITTNCNYKLILLNKPKGVISSCYDNQGRVTVLDLLPKKLQKGLYPIGRLDMESRGAILLTNNGELTMKLTHPSYSHSKTYQVLIHGVPSTNTLNEWSNGVMLNGRISRKASVELLDSRNHRSLLRIILKEGRNRQIRKTAELFGHKVIDLKRTAIGELELNSLSEGNWREIEEIEWPLLIEKSKH